MKSLLATIALLVTTTSFAQGFGSDAPIFANLSLQKTSNNMSLINPSFHLVTSAQIKFNSKSIELTLNRKMPTCPAGMMCAQVMPLPILVQLPVVEVENTGCGVKYVAQTPVDSSSQKRERVEIIDYSASTCEMVLRSIGVVTYSVSGKPGWAQFEDMATAIFYVNGEFLKAQN